MFGVHSGSETSGQEARFLGRSGTICADERGTVLLAVTVPGYDWGAELSPVVFHPGLRSRSISSGGTIPTARTPAKTRTA